MHFSVKILLLAILTTFVCGCATKPGLYDFLHNRAEVPSGTSLIFGRIYTNPFGSKESGVLGGTTFVNFISTLTNVEVSRLKIFNDGRKTFFYILLTPGDYALFQLIHDNLATSQASWRIFADFPVKTAENIVYIGDFRMNLENQTLTTTVVDDFTDASVEFSNMFPNLHKPIIKQLAKMEKMR